MDNVPSMGYVTPAAREADYHGKDLPDKQGKEEQ